MMMCVPTSVCLCVPVCVPVCVPLSVCEYLSGFVIERVEMIFGHQCVRDERREWDSSTVWVELIMRTLLRPARTSRSSGKSQSDESYRGQFKICWWSRHSGHSRFCFEIILSRALQ